MDAPSAADDFVPAGLASLGIEVDEMELAIVTGVHQVFWPPILELLSLDTSDVELELHPDLSRAPQ